jgi:hypothetical protein
MSRRITLSEAIAAILSQVLVNLSFLTTKPTGITTYALNLLPHLSSLNPSLLISPQTTQVPPFLKGGKGRSPLADYTCYPVPPNLNPDYGTKGHLRRLIWTQLQLPRIYKQLQSHPVIFSCA